MGRSLIVKLFFGSLIGLIAGAVVLGVAAAIAFGNDVFVMDGPDVVGINADSLGWTLIGLMGLSALVLTLATLAQVIAWIGTVLNTATRPDKTWFVVLLVLGLLGFGFVATLIYVVAGLDSTPQAPIDPGNGAAEQDGRSQAQLAPNGLVSTGPGGVSSRRDG